MLSDALLRLLQVSDSAFPTGAFAHSLGLEAFAEAGELRSAADLAHLARIYLSAMSTSDCVALRASYGETSLERLFLVDRLLAATKLARELRAASSSTGKRFLLSVVALTVEDETLRCFAEAARSGASPGNLAVGYGVVGPVLEVSVEEALRAFLFASAASLVAAGQKLVPLGGNVAQRLLYELGGEIEHSAMMSENLEVEEMHAFSPTVDARSMMHERQRTRLYVS